MKKANENPSERRESGQTRQAERGRESGRERQETNVGSTPSKAEGEERDVDEALRRGQE